MRRENIKETERGRVKKTEKVYMPFRSGLKIYL
jgi:hypothetical protein